jgi:cardiolipin synthase
MADASRQPASSSPIHAEIGGNLIEVIESGDTRLHALLALINGAEHSLKMLMYMFNPDHAGGVVHDALLAAARRGVEVKLLIDGFGSGVAPPFFADLGEAGGGYCVFHPSIGRRYLLRNHQKLITADDRVAIIGGANIDASYLSDEGDDRWRDLWLRLEGPEVAIAGRYFDSVLRWSHRPNAKLKSLRRMTAEFSEWRGPLQWKFSGPLSRRNSWARSIGVDLKRAKRADLIFAYWAPPGAMLRRLGRVAGRGQARVINAARSDNSTTIAAARNTYGRLLRRHVQLYEYQAAKLHTKLAIVDDVVHIGSSNFDYRSFYINLELMLRIKDAAFADAMRAYVDREIADCRPITAEMHRQRATWWRRVKWGISHFLVNVMDYTVTRRLNFRPDL